MNVLKAKMKRKGKRNFTETQTIFKKMNKNENENFYRNDN